MCTVWPPGTGSAYTIVQEITLQECVPSFTEAFPSLEADWHSDTQISVLFQPTTEQATVQLLFTLLFVKPYIFTLCLQTVVLRRACHRTLEMVAAKGSNLCSEFFQNQSRDNDQLAVIPRGVALQRVTALARIPCQHFWMPAGYKKKGHNDAMGAFWLSLPVESCGRLFKFQMGWLGYLAGINKALLQKSMHAQSTYPA